MRYLILISVFLTLGCYRTVSYEDYYGIESKRYRDKDRDRDRVSSDRSKRSRDRDRSNRGRRNRSYRSSGGGGGGGSSSSRNYTQTEQTQTEMAQTEDRDDTPSNNQDMTQDDNDRDEPETRPSDIASLLETYFGIERNDESNSFWSCANRSRPYYRFEGLAKACIVIEKCRSNYCKELKDKSPRKCREALGLTGGSVRDGRDEYSCR